MSIKVYEAYRTSASQIWDVIKYLKSEGIEFIKDGLIESEEKLMNIIDFDNNKYYLQGMDIYKDENKAKQFAVDATMRKGFKESSILQYNDLFDYSAIITIRKSGKYIYMIPYIGCGFNKNISEKILSKYDEYSYWNNSDQPSSISYKEWNKRGKVWNKICDDWDNYTEVVLSSIDSYWKISPSSTRIYMAIKKGN